MDCIGNLKKRGLVIYWAIFGFFLATAIFFLLFSRAFAEEPIEFKGQLQLGMLNSYIKAEGTLFFIDLAAKYSGKQAAVELARNGGFYKGSECGEYLGHALWNGPNKSCIPDYKSEFKTYLDSLLNEYFKAFPLQNLTLGVIDFDFKENRVIGRGMDDFKCGIFPAEGTIAAALAGYHYFTPSFNVDIGYDVEEYRKIREQAGVLLSECRGNANLDSCINDEIKRFRMPEWGFVCEGGSSTDVFDDFVAFYKGCLNTENKDCICEYMPPLNISRTEEEEVYQIRLTKDNGRTVINIAGYPKLTAIVDLPGPYFIEYYDDSGHEAELLNAVDYVVTYDADGNLYNAELNTGFFDYDIPNKKLRLYKDNSGRLNFIDTDEYFRGGFERLSSCIPKNDFTYFFCITSDTKLLIYDEVAERMINKPVQYKLALYFGNETIK